MAIRKFFLGDDAKTKAKKLDEKLVEAERGKKPEAKKPAGKKPPR